MNDLRPKRFGYGLQNIAKMRTEHRQVAGLQSVKSQIGVRPPDRPVLMPEAENLRSAQTGAGLDHNQPVVIQAVMVFQFFTDIVDVISAALRS